ncbi:uncharacterized protein LOC132719116 [Ruditapes philippinarum]|uniref:uncharacterized protein LOC132719116 n=1 Tax=Ruditapes philippinarum TaxID=129788 RepID=UPI00295AB1C0|nr:uncharacterized protein LOC132719116 [Ruditapes philippinarum]
MDSGFATYIKKSTARHSGNGRFVKMSAQKKATSMASLGKTSMLEKEILQKENNTIAAVNEKDDQITFEEAMDILEAEDDAEFSEDISTLVMTRDQGDMPVAKDEITGWGHVVGIRAKKCLNFSTRIKNCATCSFYERTGRKKRQHDCRKNWCKSAKAMEPDIAVQLHRESLSNGKKYSAVVGEEDSSSNIPRDATHHKNMPCDLHDIDIKLTLVNLLAPYIFNAPKLMISASSKANEALNHIDWSKTPKVRNYSHSESFDFRVSAAVSQFNDGNAFSEIKEGVSYQSFCAFDELEVLDTTPLPEPIVKDEQCHPKCTVVYYDLETSNVGENAEIVQLSAVCGNSKFTKFVLPKGDIHVKATAVNGLEIRIIKGNRYLFQHNQEVESCDISEALSEFLSWLNALGEGKVILAAHNGKVFDMKFLLKFVTDTKCLPLFRNNVYGFIDTLPLLRKQKPKLRSYKLTSLYEHTFGVTFDAHDALHDAKALQDIIKDQRIGFKEMESYILTTNEAVKYLLTKCRSRACAAEIEHNLCKNEKIITVSMAKKDF